jgi:hypothetical protein
MLYEKALFGRSNSSLSMHHVHDTRDGDEPCRLATISRTNIAYSQLTCTLDSSRRHFRSDQVIALRHMLFLEAES